MRFQSQPGRCGAASVVNALACFGRRIPERRVKVAEDANGDTHLSLIAAIREWGFTATEYTGQNAREAWTWLRGAIGGGSPVILCVDEFGHWVTAAAQLGTDKVVVVDSSNVASNVRENGVHVVGRRGLCRRWRGWYGIAVGRG